MLAGRLVRQALPLRLPGGGIPALEGNTDRSDENPDCSVPGILGPFPRDHLETLELHHHVPPDSGELPLQLGSRQVPPDTRPGELGQQRLLLGHDLPEIVLRAGAPGLQLTPASPEHGIEYLLEIHVHGAPLTPASPGRLALEGFDAGHVGQQVVETPPVNARARLGITVTLLVLGLDVLPVLQETPGHVGGFRVV